MTIIASYAIAVAILAVVLWVFSILRAGVPELLSRPWETRHHIAADALASVTLLGGGVMTLLGRSDGPVILAIGLGMALYAIVNGAGFLVQRRHLPSIAIFAVLFSLTAVALGSTISAF